MFRWTFLQAYWPGKTSETVPDVERVGVDWTGNGEVFYHRDQENVCHRYGAPNALATLPDSDDEYHQTMNPFAGSLRQRADDPESDPEW